MIAKVPSRRAGMTRITFSLVPDTPCDRVFLVGDFNDWQPRHPMRRRKDGSWRISVDLPAGRSHEFRYLVDGERWVNEPAADAFVPNSFGTDNCLVHAGDGAPAA